MFNSLCEYSVLLAQTTTPTKGAPNPFGGLIIPIVIFAVMIFFMFRSQRKEAKKRQNMINAVKKDDKILTAGGIVGKVVKVEDDTILLEIAEKVKIELKKTGIAGVINNVDEVAEGDKK